MKISRLPAITTCSAILSVVFALGCAGELENPELFRDAAGGRGGSSLDTNVPSEGGQAGQHCDATPIFKSKCNVCHSTESKLGKLDLEAPNPAARLVGAPAGSDSATTCKTAGKVIVSASNIDESQILDRLKSTPSCGDRMPQGGSALGASDVACIKDWALGLVEASGGSTGGNDNGSPEGGGSNNSTDGGASDSSSVSAKDAATGNN